MPSPPRVLSLVAPLLIVAAGGGGFWILANRGSEHPVEPISDLAPAVETLEVLAYEGPLNISADGVAAPARQIQVAAEVGGRICFKAACCRPGKFVESGTPLIEIDSADYILEVDQLRSRLAQADANLGELEVEKGNTNSLIELAVENLELQQKELTRLDGLQGSAVADSDLDKARLAVLGARIELQALRNQLRQLQARESSLEHARQLVAVQLKRAQLDLERTKIRAPIGGVVAASPIEQGALVQRGDPLFTLDDMSTVEITCHLRTDELYWLWVQQSNSNSSASQLPHQVPHAPVTVVYELRGQPHVRYTWRGELARYGGAGLDEQTRTVPCVVVVDAPTAVQIEYVNDNAGKKLKPQASPPTLMRGMYVTVKVHTQSPTTLVRVPARAVQPGKSVWRVRHDRLGIVKPLRLVEFLEPPSGRGSGQGTWLVESQGSKLRAGDRVVVTPLVSVAEGMPVREQSRRETSYPLGDS